MQARKIHVVEMEEEMGIATEPERELPLLTATKTEFAITSGQASQPHKKGKEMVPATDRERDRAKVKAKTLLMPIKMEFATLTKPV